MKIIHDNNQITNKKNIEDFVILSFIDVLFLCLNLSFPGSLSVKTPITLKRGFEDEINLSATSLESSFQISDDFNGWPEIRIIPIEYVVEWYNSLNIGLNIKAQNDIERTLFSFLYFCNDNHSTFNPTLIVWIIQSLESFFGIKKNDSIIKTLKNRISLHLGKAEQSNKVNKKINDFYEYRSKFVHGDMDILRYGSDKFLRDPFIDEYSMRLIKLCDFGSTLIIACIQKMIIDNTTGLYFKETIEYK